ncbi:MAG: MFS transporter [Gammaproteobacteria bacterium]|nr:MFS transporter [Gammaproteobacteria bacterium]
MSQPLIMISSKEARWFACFLVLFEFSTYIANDMIMPGMLQVVSAFHGSESQVATSLTIYLLGGASLQLFLGPLSDYYGRRPMMLIGAALFLFATFWIGGAQSMSLFLVGRFLQGMGLCFVNVVGYAALQEMFEDMDAIRYVALMANISILAPLMGPICGAMILYVGSWRWIFLVIAMLALVAWIGLSKTMPETIGAPRRVGAVIQPVPLCWRVILKNYRLLFVNRSFMLACFGLALVGTPCIAWIALAPVILVEEAHLTVAQYALWQVPVFGCCILGNLFLHHLTHTKTIRHLIILGTWLTLLSLMLMFAACCVMNGQYVWMMPGLMLYFFALSIVSAPLYRFILIVTPVGKGTASAVMSAILLGTQSVGIELANGLYVTHQNSIFSAYCLAVGLVYAGVIMGLMRDMKAE